jgi:hypothetical protein
VRNIFITALLIAALSTHSASAQTEVTLTPYTARYQVTYRGLSGGEIEFKLKKYSADRYQFSSHLLPNFLGSMFASDHAEDTTLLMLENGTTKPLQFRSEDGKKNTDKDIQYDFNWLDRQVKGHYKNEDFALALSTDVQNRLSIQLAASLSLQAGKEPGKLIMLERNELQEYTVIKQGTEKILTKAGEFDTVILHSERTGSTRSTRYWYAPSLGYIPVKAERVSKGKVDIVMELKAIQIEQK